MNNLYREKVSQKLGDVPTGYAFFYLDVGRLCTADIFEETPILELFQTVEVAVPTMALFYVPHRQNPMLRHYRSWLEKIKDALGTGKAVINQANYSRDVALHGQGGLGKTAMAVEYAHRYQGSYPGGVFWVQADLGLGQALAEIATYLGWPLPDEATDQQIIASVLPRLRTSDTKLVVLDNLNDKVVPKEIEALPASQLLVTTRLSEVTIGQPVTMGLPTEEEALGIFLAYAELEGEELREAQQEAAYVICRRAGFLPVALEILGKNARKVALIDLAQALDQAVKQKSTVGSKGQELTIAAALAVTSHNYSHPRAKEALLHLAYLYPEELNHALLAMVMSKNSEEAHQLIPEAQAMLSALAEFSVVQPKPGGGYTMHRLVQEAARLEDERQEAGNRTVQVLDAFIKAISEKGRYRDGYPLIPHLINIAELSKSGLGEDDFPSYYPMARWADFLWESGRHQASDTIFGKVQPRIAAIKGTRHPDYATLINNRATLKLSQGKIAEAEELYRQAIEIDEKTIGREHPEHLKHLNNLAEVLSKQGRYSEAEKLFRQAIELSEKTIGKEHSDYAVHLNNLAGVLWVQGKYTEAEKLYRGAMEIDEKTIGREHSRYAVHLNNLADTLSKQGRYSEAEKLFRQAIELSEKTIGKEHPDYAVRLNNLAGVLWAQGKYTEAEKMLRQAKAIDEKTISEDHPDYAVHLSSLAWVLWKQGRRDEALELQRRAVDICLRTLGPEHPHTIAIQKGLESILNEIKSRS